MQSDINSKKEPEELLEVPCDKNNSKPRELQENPSSLNDEEKDALEGEKRLIKVSDQVNVHSKIATGDSIFTPGTHQANCVISIPYVSQKSNEQEELIQEDMAIFSNSRLAEQSKNRDSKCFEDADAKTARDKGDAQSILQQYGFKPPKEEDDDNNFFRPASSSAKLGSLKSHPAREIAKNGGGVKSDILSGVITLQPIEWYNAIDNN